MKGLFSALIQKFKKSESVETIVQNEALVEKQRMPVLKSEKVVIPQYDGNYFCKYYYESENIAGVQHRNLDFSKIELSFIRFEFEPDNPYDSNAIRIYQKNSFLGYVHKNCRINDMIHSYLKNPTWQIYAKIDLIDEANQKITYQIAFFKQISASNHDLVFEKDVALTKTTKKAEEFSTSRQEALSYLSEGDMVYFEESSESDNLIVVSSAADELGEINAKDSAVIKNYLESDEYIAFGTVNDVFENDSGKYNARIFIEVYKKQNS